MKKFLLFCTLFMSTFALADQWYVLDIDTASRAKQLLDKQKNIILWCACCTNDPKQNIQLQEVNVLPYEGIANSYYIKIKGRNITTNAVVEEGIDLAYVHLLKNKKKTRNLADALKLSPLDPCTPAFDPRAIALNYNWKQLMYDQLNGYTSLRRQKTFLVELP